MPGERIDDRQVISVSGVERAEFLQGLITNDVARAEGGLVYAALLTPQGKYLADFFIYSSGDVIFLDVNRDIAADLIRRLGMYKLRARVEIEPVDVIVTRGLGAVPDGAFADPRDPALGWRGYGLAPDDRDGGVDWTDIRVAQCIPEAGIELVPNETFILEVGFERLHGVDFRKGCYVGQEVTARMKHKTELRKGLAVVLVDGTAPVGTPITTEGKPAGQLYSQSGGRGIAYLRFDRATGDMRAADAIVTRLADDA